MKLSPAAVSRSPWYWLALLLLSLSFEAVALFYQHVLDEPPCSLCIHARLWVAALLLVALAGLALHRLHWPNALLHLASLGVGAGLAERSYRLLGTERGFLMGECTIDLGTPEWFRPDQWWPQVFEPQTLCGYTPQLLFGISMAEALMAFSVVFVVLALLMTLASLKRPVSDW